MRELTLNPILISETAAAPTAGQPAKIADLFAGVHAYGLLGFVWFDATEHRTGASAARRPSPHSAGAPARIGARAMNDRQPRVLS